MALLLLLRRSSSSRSRSKLDNPFGADEDAAAAAAAGCGGASCDPVSNRKFNCEEMGAVPEALAEAAAADGPLSRGLEKAPLRSLKTK